MSGGVKGSNGSWNDFMAGNFSETPEWLRHNAGKPSAQEQEQKKQAEGADVSNAIDQQHQAVVNQAQAQQADRLSKSNALMAQNSAAAETKRQSDAQLGLQKDNSFEQAWQGAFKKRNRPGTQSYGAFEGGL